MKTTWTVLLFCGMLAVSTRADWIRTSTDLATGAKPAISMSLAAGSGAPVIESLAVGAGAVTEHAWTIAPGAATTTNFVTASTMQVLGASVGWFGGPLASVKLNVVTSGVSVCVATFTNNGVNAWAPALPQPLPAGALLTVTSAGPTTNAVDLVVRTQKIVAASGDTAARSLAGARAGPILPDGSSITLYAVTSGVRVAVATLTNGAVWSPEQPLLALAHGDTITAVPDGVTNLAMVSVDVLPTFVRILIPGPTILFSAAAGVIFPASDTAAITLTATTSTVSVVLGTFTNGAATWTAETPVEFAAGDTITASGAGVTNDAVLTLTLKPLVSPFVAPYGDMASRIVGLRVFDDPAPGPEGWSVTATLQRQGATAETLVTFTNGAAAYAPDSPVTLYTGDRLTFAAAGMTNAAIVRAMTDYQR